MWGHRHDFLVSRLRPSVREGPKAGLGLADDSRTLFPRGPRTQLLLSSPYIGTLKPNSLHYLGTWTLGVLSGLNRRLGGFGA